MNKKRHFPSQKMRQKANETQNWIWGVHPVLELLKLAPSRIREIGILTGKSAGKLWEIRQRAEAAGILLQDREQLINNGQSHQGVEALVKQVSLLSLNELLLKKREKDPLFLALDSIQDPHNLGAIIRSASAAGVSGIIIPKDRSAPLSGIVSKTAAGALAMVNLCQVTNLSEALQRLKEEKFWVYGAAGEADQSVHHTNFSGPICLVIGSEGKGLRPLIKKNCDFLISIPMHSSLDSLNASVATGVVLFEIVRQREKEQSRQSPSSL